MHIKENISLKAYSTMRLGGSAKYLSEVHDKQELTQLLVWAKDINMPLIMIGEGSNIIWTNAGYDGLVMVNRISGFKVQKLDEKRARFTFGSGEPWDKVVEKTVNMGYSGLEQLSFIPGTVGGTPVQNVGAYGQEIKDVLVDVEAYDNQLGTFVYLHNDECAFGYRTSRFKASDKGRFFITAITVELSRQPLRPPFYAALQQYFDEHAITDFSPASVRRAVIAIRTSKLPDPNETANNGSFFGNPIISSEQFSKLRQQYPDIPNWKVPNGRRKLSAAWLVEQAGYEKGYRDDETGMGLWGKQALVVVNNDARSADDIQIFKKKIVQAVEAKFDITLEQEPETIPSPSAL